MTELTAQKQANPAMPGERDTMNMHAIPPEPKSPDRINDRARYDEEQEDEINLYDNNGPQLRQALRRLCY